MISFVSKCADGNYSTEVVVCGVDGVTTSKMMTVGGEKWILTCMKWGQ